MVRSKLLVCIINDLIIGSKKGARLKRDVEDFKRKYLNNEGTNADGPNHEYVREFNKALK
jgi:hypothetical protein